MGACTVKYLPTPCLGLSTVGGFQLCLGEGCVVILFLTSSEQINIPSETEVTVGLGSVSMETASFISPTQSG